jgi:hypothetical protein
MKQIWKYPLNLTEKQFIYMPKDAEILSVQLQDNIITLWSMVNHDNADELEPRCFQIYGTGTEIVTDMGVQRKYLATVRFRMAYI